MICDLAETYGVHDYKALKPSIVATLAVGLPASSRVVRKKTGIDLTVDQMLLALLFDSLNGLIWGMGGKKRGKRPPSMFDRLMHKDKSEKKDELMAFKTTEDYEAFMRAKREKWANG